MTWLRNLVVEAIAGAALGALILGLGSRIVMRLLAAMIARDTAFSLAGTLEVIAYGAIVGAVAGAIFAVARPRLPTSWPIQGILLAALAYVGTFVTLPAHIADTARPFADRMPVVLALFGLCFLLFGQAMARISFRVSNREQVAAPAAPPE
jgi:hypothetical protein